MSSLFRARRAEEPRSGGKMLRGRRSTPSASPYSRQEASPAAAPSGSPRWLSGLISGAGKLISSVLPSYRTSPSPLSSSGYSSDEDASSDNNADEEGLQQYWNQRGNGFEVVNKRIEGQLAIEPKSETKLVIEQLLKQEKFSRDECDKLTKLIQSRVVDFPSPEVFGDATDELQRTAGNDALPRALPSSSQRRTLPERNHYSSCELNAFSARSSLIEACTPDICNKAVLEAKKWLEEKKSEAKPKYDSECGPCTLNTDTLQYGIESEGGSPVDMAKSYMRSLPPWRSATFSGVGFKTPHPSGIHHYKKETSYEIGKNSLPSSKGLKRDHLFLGDWDTLDGARQVRLKSMYDELEISKSKQSESSAKVEHGSFKSFSVADKEDLHCGDPCSTDGTFRLPDDKDADANHQLERSNLHSSNIVLESGETICAVHTTHEISVPNATPLEPTKSLAEDQPSQTIEDADNNSVHRDILASASTSVEKDENILSEIKVTLTGNIRPTRPSDPDDTAKLNGVLTQTITGVETHVLSDGCSSQLNTVSGIAEMNYSSDSRLQEGNSHMPNKANGAIKESSANCSAEVNKDRDHETSSKGADTITPQNGTRMKSIERMLTKPQAAPTRRGKKAVVKSRRGRKPSK